MSEHDFQTQRDRAELAKFQDRIARVEQNHEALVRRLSEVLGMELRSDDRRSEGPDERPQIPNA
jgi:rubrerythrin